MTTASNSAILDPVTNPVPTVAPQSKEDTTMSGATNKITALYCRLSQEDARLGESLSIENQKAILLEYAKKNHFPNPVFFVDDGYSGTNYDRPGFQSMLVEIEAGRVGIVITKDLSRLGRNSALTGLYTNFTFPQYGVRYIAINDNYDTIDPNSVNNDFAGIKNWFNEFYARDTSRKIRAVQKAKGERGVPLTVNVPYGYVKDPENPKHWLVDPEAAAIVKRIFSMCMEGRGPTQIANQLWVDKVLTPTAYKLSHGLSTNSPAPEDPYRWDKRAVSSILERLEYTGCTVNFKTYTNSIWDKCIAGNVINRQDKNGGNGCGYQQGVSYTLTTEDRHCVAYTDDLQRKKRVRKLIPLECERLMGFPDHWTDIPGASDSVRYRALGNSVAVPCVEYILCGIAYFLERQEGERDVHIPG